jgi:hypothetical protein
MPFLYFITAPILRNQSERARKHWTLPNPKGFDPKQKYSVPSVYLTATSAPIRDGYYNVNLNGSETIASNAGSMNINTHDSVESDNLLMIDRIDSKLSTLFVTVDSALVSKRANIQISPPPMGDTSTQTSQSLRWKYKFTTNVISARKLSDNTEYVGRESKPSSEDKTSTDVFSYESDLNRIITNFFQPKIPPTDAITTNAEKEEIYNKNNINSLFTLTSSSQYLSIGTKVEPLEIYKKWSFVVSFDTIPAEGLSISGDFQYSNQNDRTKPLVKKLISKTLAKQLKFSVYWPIVGPPPGLENPLFAYNLTFFDAQQKQIGNLSTRLSLSYWYKGYDLQHGGGLSWGSFAVERSIKRGEINQIDVKISIRSAADRTLAQLATLWLWNNYKSYFPAVERSLADFGHINNAINSGEVKGFNEISSIYLNLFKNSVTFAHTIPIANSNLKVLLLKIAPTLNNFFIVAGDGRGNPRPGTYLSFADGQFRNDPERYFYSKSTKQVNGIWQVTLVVPNNTPVFVMAKAGSRALNIVSVIYTGPQITYVHNTGRYAAQQVKPLLSGITLRPDRLDEIYGQFLPYLGTPDEARRNFPAFAAAAAAGTLFLGASATPAAASGLASWLSSLVKDFLKDILKQATEGLTPLQTMFVAAKTGFYLGTAKVRTPLVQAGNWLEANNPSLPQTLFDTYLNNLLKLENPSAGSPELMGANNRKIVDDLLGKYRNSGFFSGASTIPVPKTAILGAEPPIFTDAEGPGTALIKSIQKSAFLTAIGGVIGTILKLFNITVLNNGLPVNILLAKGVLGGTVFPWVGFSFPGTQVTDMSISVAVPYTIREKTETKPASVILLILNYAVARPDVSKPFSTFRIMGGAEADIQFPFATNMRREFREFYKKRGFFEDGRLPILEKILSARIVKEKDNVDFWSIKAIPAFATGYLASYRENTVSLAAYIGGGISISAEEEPEPSLNAMARATYELVKNFSLPIYYYWTPWSYSFINNGGSSRPYWNTICNILDITLRNSGYRTNLLRRFSRTNGTLEMSVGTFDKGTKIFTKKRRLDLTKCLL